MHEMYWNNRPFDFARLKKTVHARKKLLIRQKLTRKRDGYRCTITDVATSSKGTRLYKSYSPRWITEDELYREYALGWEKGWKKWKPQVKKEPELKVGTKLIRKKRPRLEHTIIDIVSSDVTLYGIHDYSWCTKKEIYEEFHVEVP